MIELNTKYNEIISGSKKQIYKDYDDMVNELMEMPKRKESLFSEGKSDMSTIGDMEMELEAFELEVLGGEKFQPINQIFYSTEMQ